MDKTYLYNSLELLALIHTKPKNVEGLISIFIAFGFVRDAEVVLPYSQVTEVLNSYNLGIQVN